MKRTCLCVLLVSAVCATAFGQSVVPGSSFGGKMRWLAANVQSGGKYAIDIADDESTTPMTLFFGEKKNVSIAISGSGSDPTVLSLSNNGAMFTVESGITLILGDMLVLKGGVNVKPGGVLIMNEGSSGGRVYVDKNGLFTMNGGEITGWSANNGGGVYVAGTFTMNGGKIFGNSASASSYGGGVYVDGTFIMNGGEISGNTATSTFLYDMAFDVSKYPGGAGGVYVAGTFTMNNGKISGNASRPYSSIHPTAYAGGVYVNGNFTMKGGEISGNSASHGGGVYVNSGKTFTMGGGTISGNISGNGAGVDVDGGFTMSGGEVCNNKSTGVDVQGTFILKGGKIFGNGSKTCFGGGVAANKSGVFTMESGEISGNIAGLGGGVKVDGGATFSKIGGTVYGYSTGEAPDNVVLDKDKNVQQNLGHAIYVRHSNNMYVMKKDATSGPADKLSFNGKPNPPVSNGKWERDF